MRPIPLRVVTMLRREPGPSSPISEWELGLAAILFLVVVLATTLLVPAFA